jgi:hypothetical protein
MFAGELFGATGLRSPNQPTLSITAPTPRA